MRMPPYTIDTAIMCRLNDLAGDVTPGVHDLDAPAAQGVTSGKCICSSLSTEAVPKHLLLAHNQCIYGRYGSTWNPRLC